AIRPHAGHELRNAAEREGEREQVTRRGRVPPPPGEVRRDDEGRAGEAEEAENGRRRNRLEEDARTGEVPVPPVGIGGERDACGGPLAPFVDRAHTPPTLSFCRFHRVNGARLRIGTSVSSRISEHDLFIGARDWNVST